MLFTISQITFVGISVVFVTKLVLKFVYLATHFKINKVNTAKMDPSVSRHRYKGIEFSLQVLMYENCKVHL